MDKFRIEEKKIIEKLKNPSTDWRFYIRILSYVALFLTGLWLVLNN